MKPFRLAALSLALLTALSITGCDDSGKPQAAAPAASAAADNAPAKPDSAQLAALAEVSKSCLNHRLRKLVELANAPVQVPGEDKVDAQA